MSNSDFNACPVCRSGNTEGKGFEQEGNQLIQPCWCQDCDAEWSAVWRPDCHHITNGEEVRKSLGELLGELTDDTDIELYTAGYAYSERERAMARDLYQRGYRNGLNAKTGKYET